MSAVSGQASCKDSDILSRSTHPSPSNIDPHRQSYGIRDYCNGDPSRFKEVVVILAITDHRELVRCENGIDSMKYKESSEPDESAVAGDSVTRDSTVDRY